MSPTVYRIGITLALCVAAVLAATSAAQDAQTHDEAVHLTGGYSYWRTGDFRISPEHPPLFKLLAASPLLLLDPEFRPDKDDWQHVEDWPISRNFLYHNRVAAETMLMSARAVTIFLGLVLAVSLAWWVTAHAGRAAGFAAFLMFAFEPTVLAHSRYVTTDIPVTLFIWLASISAIDYLKKGTRGPLLRTGILLGLAFATKFNALFLPIVLLLTWRLYRKPTWRQTFLHAGALAGIAIVVVLLTYGFNTRSAMEDPVMARQIEAGRSEALLRDAATVPIPGYYFLRGLHLMIRHQTGGHFAYFMGDTGSRGSWLYFPVALLVKSSLAWLALLILAIAIAVFRRSFWKEHRDLLLPLAIPAGIYFAFAVISPVNIGIRHVLPIYPFLCAFSAIVLFSDKQWRILRAAATILLALFLAESASAYPNYLAYFNQAAGGPKNGHHYLLDSNLDWGQDLKRLARYADKQDVQPLCLAYFGTADPAYYGIRFRPLPALQTAEDLEQLNCVAAVSAEYLYGLKDHPFKALQSLKPTTLIGASIYLYDLRQLPKK
jgi:4-amino-4-deoxy-L-arabinose transferase-like glycosyltransferase